MIEVGSLVPACLGHGTWVLSIEYCWTRHHVLLFNSGTFFPVQQTYVALLNKKTCSTRRRVFFSTRRHALFAASADRAPLKSWFSRPQSAGPHTESAARDRGKPRYQSGLPVIRTVHGVQTAAWSMPWDLWHRTRCLWLEERSPSSDRMHWRLQFGLTWTMFTCSWTPCLDGVCEHCPWTHVCEQCSGSRIVDQFRSKCRGCYCNLWVVHVHEHVCVRVWMVFVNTVCEHCSLTRLVPEGFLLNLKVRGKKPAPQVLPAPGRGSPGLRSLVPPAPKFLSQSSQAKVPKLKFPC